FFSSRRRHTRCLSDWSSDVCSSDLVMVSFCTVCRTGRVFDPVVDGRIERFRLVGMDHFNAMFEDVRTRSWWRQATGEAMVGPMRSEERRVGKEGGCGVVRGV